MDRRRQASASLGGLLVGGGVVYWLQFGGPVVALGAVAIGVVLTPGFATSPKVGAENGAVATAVATLTVLVVWFFAAIGRVDSLSADGWTFLVGIVGIGTLLLSGVIAAVLVGAGAFGGWLQATSRTD